MPFRKDSSDLHTGAAAVCKRGASLSGVNLCLGTSRPYLITFFTRKVSLFKDNLGNPKKLSA